MSSSYLHARLTTPESAGSSIAADASHIPDVSIRSISSPVPASSFETLLKKADQTLDPDGQRRRTMLEFLQRMTQPNLFTTHKQQLSEYLVDLFQPLLSLRQKENVQSAVVVKENPNHTYVGRFILEHAVALAQQKECDTFSNQIQELSRLTIAEIVPTTLNERSINTPLVRIRFCRDIGRNDRIISNAQLRQICRILRRFYGEEIIVNPIERVGSDDSSHMQSLIHLNAVLLVERILPVAYQFIVPTIRVPEPSVNISLHDTSRLPSKEAFYQTYGAPARHSQESRRVETEAEVALSKAKNAEWNRRFARSHDIPEFLLQCFKPKLRSDGLYAVKASDFIQAGSILFKTDIVEPPFESTTCNQKYILQWGKYIDRLYDKHEVSQEVKDVLQKIPYSERETEKKSNTPAQKPHPVNANTSSRNQFIADFLREYFKSKFSRNSSSYELQSRDLQLASLMLFGIDNEPNNYDGNYSEEYLLQWGEALDYSQKFSQIQQIAIDYLENTLRQITAAVRTPPDTDTVHAAPASDAPRFH
jgi:hypothetical protein